MFEIDTGTFTWRHSPDLLGIFEPVSRVMFLNATDEEFESMRADYTSSSATEDLWEAFWHETYHCFQVFSCGYMYLEREQLIEALGKNSFTEWRSALAIIRKHLWFRIKFR